jgi:predicted DsbA family dithiol-disulfide isomerase
MTEPLTIDVVSDVVCPWCYVGKRRLERALVQQSDDKVEIRWLPFFLDPSVPPGGIPRIDYITRKFGTPGKITPAHERLVGIGASIGIDFKFERIERQPNTLDAHRVIGWAQEAGRASSVVNRLFELFFTEGADIGAHDVLIEAGKFAGLDAGRLRQDLAGDRDTDLVARQVIAATNAGIGGVPFFVFDKKLAVAGAQEEGVLLEAMRKVRGDGGEPTQAA